MAAAGAHLEKCTLGRCGLPIIVCAPTVQCFVRLDPTTMIQPSRTNQGKSPARQCRIAIGWVSPAAYGCVRLYAACAQTTGADLSKYPLRWCCLSVPVLAPADYSPVHAQSTCVCSACADLDE